MRASACSSILPSVLRSDATIVVSDAHLGTVSQAVADGFHRFLEQVPDLCGHLVVNGDLFDFWFEYRLVIPSAHFRTLTALKQVREAGVRLTMTGGNHDRWGSRFLVEQLGARFAPNGAELELSGWRTWVGHGDGLAEVNLSSKLLHGLVHARLTAAAFRWIHPDLGLSLVKMMSRPLAGRHTAKLKSSSADAQAVFAHSLLGRRADLDLVILGHTHQPVLEEVEPKRWYLNPGAWMDSFCYALITRGGPELRKYPEQDMKARGR